MGFVASLDMYRKVPNELLEGTKRGSFLSLMAVFVMITLFLLETNKFISTTLRTDLGLDTNPDRRIRVNFNITMMDLSCEFAVVDVVSALGTDQNITQHITKFQIDQDGVNKRFHARNKYQHDLIMYDETVTESIEELHSDGEDATPYDKESLENAKKEYQFLFIDFYASWCSHCRDLAPTWETLAEVMDTAASHVVDLKIEEERKQLGDDHDWTDEDYEHAIKVTMPVKIGKVDCVEHDSICREEGIVAYPTLRLFVEGDKYGADYSGHRTVVSFTDYLATIEKDFMRVQGGADKADKIARKVHEERGGSDKVTKTARRVMKKEWIENEHPGCQLSGFLMLDRVPGNFHIQARSKSHDIVPSMTNVSHEIHHLSFGEPYIRRKLEGGLISNTNSVPKDLLSKTNPMDGNVYITDSLHTAHHHYLKVITTNFMDRWISRRVYQVLQESQLTYMKFEEVPEAQFKYDLSPIAVTYRQSKVYWYDYLTSLMAIIGGTFTIVGMMESGIHAATKKKRR